MTPISEIQAFIHKMSEDMEEISEMIESDENLLEAIKRFEKAHKTKLKVTIDEPTTNGQQNPD